MKESPKLGQVATSCPTHGRMDCRHPKRFAAFALSLALAGCAGFDEAVDIADEYADTPVAEYENVNGSWRIADMSGQGRLKIGPSLARSFSAAFGNTVTFVDMPREEYEMAVQGFLASTGRTCMVMDGQLLVSPQWEFRYSCR